MVKYCKLILISTLILIPTLLVAQNRYVLKTVVLDAGHGGNQPGAVWGKYLEKDITLNVAKTLGALITSNYPNVKVVYTRTTDVAVDLYKRSKIANDANADLFISIHVNAARSTSATGTETFVMGTSKSQQNLDVAMAENSVISYESDYHTRYEGFDPNSAESYIIFSLMQYSYLEQSLSFASAVQSEFTAATPMMNRGVKQAGFLVLWNNAMPSVLTEIGFLSNAKNRAYVVTSKGQQTIAKSLFKAFSNYKNQIENSSSPMLAEVVKEQAPQGSPPVVVEQPKPEPVEVAAKKVGNIFFTVQVKSSLKIISINSVTFGEYAPKVWHQKIDGRHKYFVEKMNSYKEALSLQNSIRRKRVKDAFIVAYDGKKQITVAKAKKITEQAN